MSVFILKIVLLKPQAGLGRGPEQDSSLSLPPSLPVRAAGKPETSSRGAGFVHSTASLLGRTQVNMAALCLALGPSEVIVCLT